MLYAGTAEFDITPPAGLLLKGYARPPRANLGAHDPLKGCCAYLNEGETEIAIVTLDLLYASKSMCARIGAAVQEKCGICADYVWVCCSHTHSGPRAFESVDGTPMTEDETAYVKNLVESASDAIRLAKESRFPAFTGITQEICGAESGIGGNRDHAGGVCDPRVGVLGIWDEYGTLRCALVNYALHPTLLRETNLLASADYPGYVRIAIQTKYPACAFGFVQGASGDQSSRYYRQGDGFQEAERFGNAIADAAGRALDACNRHRAPILRAAVHRFPIRLRTFPPMEQMEARRKETTAEYERLLKGSDPMAAHNAKQKMLGAECKIDYARALERMKQKGCDDAEVCALRVGENCIVGVMGEYFVEYGLAIRALSGAPVTLVASLTNGCLPGYVCTPLAYAEGGYEPDASMLHETFGQEMTWQAIETVRGLFA